MKTLKNFNFKDKKVLVRCDFNVSISKAGKILEDFRIKQTLPTINYLIKKKAKVILMSHLGDPEGKVIESLRLTPVQKKLEEYLGSRVVKTKDCIGKETEESVSQMKPGEVLLLENLRFHKEEEENDQNFSKELAKLADVFINDAFGVCHRAHASVVGIPKILPSGVGLLLEKEIKVLSQFIKKAKKPLIAIVGGKKVETKAKFIDKISKISDWVLISGLIQEEIKEKGIKLEYPQKIVEPVDSLDGKDIGPETIKIFEEKIALAKTIFWNGPVGKYEKREFEKGSKAIAEGILKSGAFSIVGGGETVEFLNKIGLIEKFGHVSTGGGAMLSFLAGEKLPGIEALK